MPSKVKTKAIVQEVKPVKQDEPVQAPSIPPPNWPSTIAYLLDQTYTSSVTPDQRAALGHIAPTTTTYPRIPPASIPIPSPLVAIRPITNPTHPAYTQLGLFAAVPLPPDTFICLYLGRVHTNALADSDATSDYDLSFDRDLGLSIDAAREGNESRCVNDYRGVPGATGPNAEFRDCLVKVPCEVRKGGWKWERRVGVFVLAAGKAGKRKAGIAVGAEILVSYGKGFWDGRKGSEEVVDVDGSADS